MIIREANYLDWPDIVRMGEKFTKLSDASKLVEYDPASLLSWLSGLSSNKNMIVFVAEHEDKIIGMVGGIVFPVFWSQSSMLAQELFWWVDEDSRKTTAGRMMRNRLESWAKDNNAKAFYMVCLADERSGRIERLYRRAGYTPTEHTFVKVL